MNRVSLVKYVFVAVGALMLVGALVVANDTRTFVADARGAHGVVVDLVRSRSSDSDTYAPIVRFETETGETIEFRSTTSSSPPSYSRGERVGVLYRPLSPRDARIDDFESLWASSILFAVIGALFFCVGLGLLVAGALAARKASDLMRRGKRIATTVERVEEKTNVTVNGVHPYRVYTRSKASATARVFESGFVWFDPSETLKGREVPVFVDPDDPSRYHVDLSAVHRSAVQGPADSRSRSLSR